jgi:carbonic anhydrase/acetyltransferase-like protein (isoleucine patch superfamily)
MRQQSAVIGGVHLQKCEVIGFVYRLNGGLTPVMDRYGSALIDNVSVSKHEAVIADDEARPC